MNEIRVECWNELGDRLFENSWNFSLRRHRPARVFRGMSHEHYGLKTSLIRLGGTPRDLEEHILRAFQKYASSSHDMTHDSLWNWLALGKHHGLPTRLLDWTYSPMVAMHMATENMEAYGVDGVIWDIDFGKTNELLPDRLRAVLLEFGSQVFTASMLEGAARTLSDFDGLSTEPFVVFFEPPSLDARIVNQYALFSLVSDPALSLDEWLAQHPDVVRRIVIPAGLKWEVRDKLDQSNVTERVLYPGLDGLSQWLKRYYTPRVTESQECP